MTISGRKLGCEDGMKCIKKGWRSSNPFLLMQLYLADYLFENW